MLKFFIDTETTGVLKTSRIVQIAYLICDNYGNIVKKVNEVIYPNGYIICNSKIHNITTEHALKHGKCMNLVLNTLEEDIKLCDTFIAHNYLFDYNKLVYECSIYNKQSLLDYLIIINKECTMKMGKEYLKIVKYPKLIHLYNIIENTNKEQIHDAYDDILMCKICYYKMKNIKNITIYNKCDILLHRNDIQKLGFDKNKTFEEIKEIAIANNCPVIIKAGLKGKWYIKGKNMDLDVLKKLASINEGKYRNGIICYIIE